MRRISRFVLTARRHGPVGWTRRHLRSGPRDSTPIGVGDGGSGCTDCRCWCVMVRLPVSDPLALLAYGGPYALVALGELTCGVGGADDPARPWCRRGGALPPWKSPGRSGDRGGAQGRGCRADPAAPARPFARDLRGRDDVLDRVHGRRVDVPDLVLGGRVRGVPVVRGVRFGNPSRCVLVAGGLRVVPQFFGADRPADAE